MTPKPSIEAVAESGDDDWLLFHLRCVIHPDEPVRQGFMPPSSSFQNLTQSVDLSLKTLLWRYR